MIYRIHFNKALTYIIKVQILIIYKLYLFKMIKHRRKGKHFSGLINNKI